MTNLEKSLFTALRDIVYDDRSQISKGLHEKAVKQLAAYRKQAKQEERDKHPCY